MEADGVCLCAAMGRDIVSGGYQKRKGISSAGAHQLDWIFREGRGYT